MKISLTPFAINCIEEISEYILNQTKSESVSQKIVDIIFDALKLLNTHPEIGKKEEALIHTGENYRFIIEGNYKILYKILDEKHIVVTDIFHIKQNPEKIKTREKKSLNK